MVKQEEKSVEELMETTKWKIPPTRVASDDCAIYLDRVIEDGEIIEEGTAHYIHKDEWVELFPMQNLKQLIALAKVVRSSDGDAKDMILSQAEGLRELCEALSKRIVSWNWTDNGGEPLPQPYKAPDVLIETVAVCIAQGLELELVMLGDGQYKPQLERQAQRLGIAQNISFLGRLPAGKAIYEQFDQADLYVLPSRQEGLPRSVIEAMARGLPCIGSNVGGFSELLSDKDMVAPGNAKALADKIKEVIVDIAAMKQAVRANVEKARKYSKPILEKKRNEFYRRLAQNAKKMSRS